MYILPFFPFLKKSQPEAGEGISMRGFKGRAPRSLSGGSAPTKTSDHGKGGDILFYSTVMISAKEEC